MIVLRRILLAVTLLYWAGICTLTHLPRLPHVGPEVSDKTAHLLAYGALAGCLYLTLWVMRPNLRWTGLYVLFIVLAYGAVDEWTQPLVGRTCDLWDWIADLGGATAILCALSLVRWLLAQLPRPAASPQLAAARQS